MDLLPRTTPIPSSLIFDLTLSAALFLSFARLYATSWRNDYLHTDPMEFERLMDLLDLKHTQAHLHLRLLRMVKLIDWVVEANGRYVIQFLTSGQKESGKTSPVVDDLISENISIKIQQQPAFGNANSRDGDLESPVVAEVFSYLVRAGIWSDAARRIARQVAANEISGQDSLPTRADVLGWIAYCFAGQQRNRIKQPAAVLAVNLNANRRCPQEFRPHRVCQACGGSEGFCRCPGDPDYHFPIDFLENALRPVRERSSWESWGA